MATLKQLRSVAAKSSGDIEINREYGEVCAWLPDGWLWRETGAQVAVVSYGYTAPGIWPGMYDRLIELIEDGAEKTA